MLDVYVLDRNLRPIGVIDAYKSLIWANRYKKNGDCELYIGAADAGAEMLVDGNYLLRPDDDMICRIKKIELDTDAKNGNYLTVTGEDAKAFLDQRVIWETETCNGSVEDFIRKLVTDSLISPAVPARRLVNSVGGSLMTLDTAAGLPYVTSEQVSYKPLGEKIREYCETYDCGYRVRFDKDDGRLIFGLYEGADRSNDVFFSDTYENLSTTKYISDNSNLGNVALIGGQGEGAERVMCAYGEASSVDRYEKFVDARDVSSSITWEALTEIYPTQEQGGSGRIEGEGETYFYIMGSVDVQVIDDAHLAQLRQEYPDGQVITISGHRFYRISDAVIADLATGQPEENTTVNLRMVIYQVYLLNRGAEHLAEYGRTVTFEGSVVPDVTFVYKKDYFLGDLVTVENEYGIRATARITEVVEVMDDKGYSMEPKFEYKTLEV